MNGHRIRSTGPTIRFNRIVKVFFRGPIVRHLEDLAVFFILEWFYFPFFKDWKQRFVGLKI